MQHGSRLICLFYLAILLHPVLLNNGISIDQPASKHSITTVKERQERHSNCTPSRIFANSLKVHLIAVLQCADKTMDVVELLISNCIYIKVTMTHILKRSTFFFGHFPNGKCYASFFCFGFFLTRSLFCFLFFIQFAVVHNPGRNKFGCKLTHCQFSVETLSSTSFQCFPID